MALPLNALSPNLKLLIQEARRLYVLEIAGTDDPCLEKTFIHAKVSEICREDPTNDSAYVSHNH